MRFHSNIRDPKQDAVYQERVAEERRKYREKRGKDEARRRKPQPTRAPEERVMGMELDWYPDTYYLLELLVWGMQAMKADLEEGNFFAGHDREDDARETIAWGEEFSAAIEAWQEQNELVNSGAPDAEPTQERFETAS